MNISTKEAIFLLEFNLIKPLFINEEQKKAGGVTYLILWLHMLAWCMTSLTQIARHKVAALTVVFSPFPTSGFNQQDEKSSGKLLCVFCLFVCLFFHSFLPLLSIGPVLFPHFGSLLKAYV